MTARALVLAGQPPAADALAARRAAEERRVRAASLRERVSRARGNYERAETDANYVALLEAEQAWLRHQLEDMTAERDGWRDQVRDFLRRVRAARALRDAPGGTPQGERNGAFETHPSGAPQDDRKRGRGCGQGN